MPCVLIAAALCSRHLWSAGGRDRAYVTNVTIDIIWHWVQARPEVLGTSPVLHDCYIRNHIIWISRCYLCLGNVTC
jgi:hypothetical protein